MVLRWVANSGSLRHRAAPQLLQEKGRGENMSRKHRSERSGVIGNLRGEASGNAKSARKTTLLPAEGKTRERPVETQGL